MINKFICWLVGHKIGGHEGNATHVWMHCERCRRLLFSWTRKKFDECLGQYYQALKEAIFPPIEVRNLGEVKMCGKKLATKRIKKI